MANKKDRAIDNLWITTDDSKSFIISPPPSSKLIKRGSMFSKGSKVKGGIVYFVPKNIHGEITGSPVRLLRDNKGNFINANIVAPYYENILENKSKWEAIGAHDLILRAEEKLGLGEAIATSGILGRKPSRATMTPIGYGANSEIDLLDSNRLETVSGIYGYGGRNLMMGLDTWAMQYGANGEGEVEAKTPSAYGMNAIAYGADGKPQGHLHEKLEFPNKDWSLMRQPTEDLGADGKHLKKHLQKRSLSESFPYNPLFRSLEPSLQVMTDLGADGSRGRHANKVYDMRRMAMPHGNPEADFDIQFGVDANNVDIESNFLGTPHNKFDIVFGADGDKQLYSAEEMESLRASTKTKRPLLDWLNSDSAKNLLSSIGKVADTVKSIKGGKTIPLGQGGNVGQGGINPPKDDAPAKKTETKIAGMTPITFGIVAFGLIAVASVVTIVLIKKGKAKEALKSVKA